MDNFHDPPLPPGVNPAPNTSIGSLNPPAFYPPLAPVNTKHDEHPHYSGNLFPFNPSSASFPSAQNFNPHFQPSIQIPFSTGRLPAPFAPNVPGQQPSSSPTNMPCYPLVHQQVPGLVNSFGPLHGTVQPHVESNGFQFQQEISQEWKMAGANFASRKNDPSEQSSTSRDKLMSSTRCDGDIVDQHLAKQAETGDEMVRQKENAISSGKCESTMSSDQYNSEYHDHPSKDIPAADTSYSMLSCEDANAIESAAQDAVLREQEIATQEVIHNQRRQAIGTTGPVEDSKDVLSGRYDSNALKVALLKMTADHRAEMTCKRGKSSHPDDGNIDIGNGYGVPGGGAYYARPLTITSRKCKDEVRETSPTSYEESESKSASKELPEYLKQRLKARGILKDGKANGCSTTTENKLEAQPGHSTSALKLPLGWVEAMDPASGSVFFYNEETGKSQWEHPTESASCQPPPASSPLPQDWLEAIDESTGERYYYNTKTLVSQWENPSLIKQVVSQPAYQVAAGNEPTRPTDHEPSHMKKCMGCAGWGLGLVQSWGYCNHCTRMQNLPFQQYSFPNLNDQQKTSNVVSSKSNSGKAVPNHRSSIKPPIGKGNRKDNRKRAYAEDDELDPMDPSSYSDAPRGGWVVGLKGVQPRAADTTATYAGVSHTGESDEDDEHYGLASMEKIGKLNWHFSCPNLADT